ncbi:PfkB family carbohydrate kinase [Terracidiphilus gabretensis]|uniref:PfkB family carbohydrate kinase n=1 Tax=Terracidiphilus gabretensis TaxID=1577687 RepID=UPI0009EB2208|nr:PfkB family carbohydrate kinase [Terracidiphilus gabretensis]
MTEWQEDSLRAQYTVPTVEISSILDSIPSVSAAVIGDFCLDIYWAIDRSASELSIETGLNTEPVSHQRYSPGGAGNVVMNLLALGVETVYPVGVLGEDPFGRELRLLFKDPHVNCTGLVSQDKGWATPAYIKPCVESQELSRIDIGNFNRLSDLAEAELLTKLEEILRRVSVVLINHQVTGSIHDSPAFRHRLAQLIERYPQLIFIVDSRGYHDSYPKAIHKLNEHEIMRASGKPVDAHETVLLEDLIQQAPLLCERWNSPLIVTRGERGCIIAAGGEVSRVYGLQLSGPLDPVGAGDTFCAALMACISAGAGLASAAFVANIAAAVTVQKLLQTGTASRQEILELGKHADRVHNPELAESLHRARYIDGSEIETINKPIPALNIRHILFDHDGTISTLRQGWEEIMEPMMIRSILGTQHRMDDEAVFLRIRKRVREFIERTTGIQTIAQMHGLAQLIGEFGLVPENQVRSATEYKEMFNKELTEVVDMRIAKLDRGELSVSDFTLKGVVPFLRALRQAGVLLYLASGTDVEDVKREAERLGYADVFDGRIYGSIGEVDKDAKRIVIEGILNKINGAAEQIITFGDGPVEIRETVRRDALAVGVASNELRRFGLNPEKRTRLIRAGANAVVPDFSQWQKLWEVLQLPRPRLQNISHPQFDRSHLQTRKLNVRVNKVNIERDAVLVEATPGPISPATAGALVECAEKIRAARSAGRPVMLAFGAHTIKNGLAPVLIQLMEQGWVTLLATNGAGIIHDWEFAFQGFSSEDVRSNVNLGQFGMWEETGFNLNLALIVGAYEGIGYGEAVGKMIMRDGLDIPVPEELLRIARTNAEQDPSSAASALDLADTIQRFGLEPGFRPIPHPFKKYSAQAAAFRLNIPFTAHPMFGHDVIYTHPINNGAAIGRVALRDFLTYAEQVHRLEGGVYLSVGSAVMSPMVFEKSLSMSQNLELLQERKITNHHMVIVDLAENSWDWQRDGEPPADNPAYYLRFCKTFSRMGGTMRYVCADNRDFLLALLQELRG